MALTTDKNKIIYQLDGTTTAFTFDFPIIEDTDLQVWVYDANGNKTLLTLNTDYTVAVTDTGGTVTLNNAYETGYTLLIYREVPYTQDTVYPENSPFPAKSHEKALDKLTMETQQLNEKINRALLKDAVNQSLDLEGTIIHNIGNAVEAQDALAKGQLLNEIKNIDGAGSGIDADLLDGQEGSYYANTALSNVNDSTILDKIKNVDGSGSGLDADLLDGHDISDFLIKDPSDGKYNANNILIKNVPNPSSSQDVCNYQTVVNLTSGNTQIHILNDKGSTTENDEMIIADSNDEYNNKKITIEELKDFILSFIKITHFDYIESSDPTDSINPEKQYATWINTSTGIIFVCIDNTANANVWEELTLNNLSNVDDSIILTKLKNVDGSGSGLDADTLDGKDSTYFLAASTYTASDILTKLKTVDGSGSGLDADLIRGLPADFTVNKNSSGYQKLPSGLIIQWGSVYKGTDPQTVSFPIVFPNACVSVMLDMDADAASEAFGSVRSTYINTTGFAFSAWHYDDTYGEMKTLNTGTHYWMAIGY